MNRAAETGAQLAAPIIADTIKNMSIADAAAIIKGGDRAATTLLQNELGSSLATHILPGVSKGLNLFDNEIINLALSQVSDINFADISEDVTNKVSDSIYRSIAAQEAKIRANPAATNDPMLIAVFGLTQIGFCPLYDPNLSTGFCTAFPYAVFRPAIKSVRRPVTQFIAPASGAQTA